MYRSNTLQDPKLLDLLKDGAVGIIPTDTVYGLVCSAANEAAVKRLYSLKNRESKPGTVIAASSEHIVSLGIKARYIKAVEHYWPNAISIEIPHGISYLNQGTGRQAFRIPKDELLHDFLNHVGALQTTSANHPGKREATTIQEAEAYFGDKVDFYVDGGDLSDRQPSTLIRIVDDAVEVVRTGSITINPDGTIAN